MDCCKLTVKALTVPRGIILPECQRFNWTPDLSLVYLNLHTHGKSDIAVTYDNRISRPTCTEQSFFVFFLLYSFVFIRCLFGVWAKKKILLKEIFCNTSENELRSF